jgi:hypothetical protein
MCPNRVTTADIHALGALYRWTHGSAHLQKPGECLTAGPIIYSISLAIKCQSYKETQLSEYGA